MDDLSPEIMGHAFGQLMAAGALDVYLQPLTMKKNRLGQMISVICSVDDEEAMARMMFTETSTLGIRRQEIERHILDREIQILETLYGPVQFKIARYGGELIGCYPEYESLKKLSDETGRPLKELMHLRPLKTIDM